MFKKFPSNKINVTKNPLFFLLRALSYHSFTFNSVHLSKTVSGIFYFRCSLVFIEVYIFFNSLTLKRHNSFQKKNNRKATHSFAPDF